MPSEYVMPWRKRRPSSLIRLNLDAPQSQSLILGTPTNQMKKGLKLKLDGGWESDIRGKLELFAYVWEIPPPPFF